MPLELGCIDRAVEDVLISRRNLRDGAVWGSALLLFLFEDPPPVPEFRADDEDLRLKKDELNDESAALNDTGPLWDV